MNIADKFISLYRDIQSLLPHQDGKTVQFVNLCKEDDTSILLYEFAKIVAMRLEKWVLLVDINPIADNNPHFSVGTKTGWGMAAHGERSLNEVICRVGESRLFVSRFLNQENSLISLIDSPQINTYLDALKREFDLVLFNSLPAYSDSISLSLKVDGVVLVLESEEIHWHVAQNIKEMIEERNGLILGAVLNKHKHYIPTYIYNKL